MNDILKIKYLKYKKKYIYLKNIQKGGSSRDGDTIFSPIPSIPDLSENIMENMILELNKLSGSVQTNTNILTLIQKINDLNDFIRLLSKLIFTAITRTIKKIPNLQTIFKDNKIPGIIKNNITQKIKELSIRLRPKPSLNNMSSLTGFLSRLLSNPQLLNYFKDDLIRDISLLISEQGNIEAMKVLDKKTYIIHWSSHRIEIYCAPLNVWICPTNPGDDEIETMDTTKLKYFQETILTDKLDVIFDSGNSLPTLIHPRALVPYGLSDSLEYVKPNKDGLTRFMNITIELFKRKMIIQDYLNLVGLNQDSDSTQETIDKIINLVITLFTDINLFNLFIEDHLNELIGCLSFMIGNIAIPDIINGNTEETIQSKDMLDIDAQNYKKVKVFSNSNVPVPLLRRELNETIESQRRRRLRRTHYLSPVAEQVYNEYLGILVSAFGWTVGRGVGDGIIVSNVIALFQFRLEDRNTTIPPFHIKAIVQSDASCDILFGIDVIAKLSAAGIYIGINDSTLDELPMLTENSLDLSMRERRQLYEQLEGLPSKLLRTKSVDD
jgi:hypothetical protein